MVLLVYLLQPTTWTPFTQHVFREEKSKLHHDSPFVRGLGVDVGLHN